MARRKVIPYISDLKGLAKEFRRNMTLSEVSLWNELKQKNLDMILTGNVL
jgi:very-short-patch-repair endonuclease